MKFNVDNEQHQQRKKNEFRSFFFFFSNENESVGDALCTIASATSFPEPFLHDGKHLRFMHRNLAGNRYSDHLALLNAFQQYEREKFVDEHRNEEKNKIVFYR